MKFDASEQYALLLAGNQPGDEQLLTRPSGVTTTLGDVLLGVDHEGRRHLLVPISPKESPNDRVSRGISLGHRDLVVQDTVVRFADLTCTIRRLTQPFDRLVEDIIVRLARNPNAAIDAVTATLDDWRALLRRSLDDLSRDEIVGLIGELEVLALLAKIDPVAAVLDWTGPTGAVHDFSREGRDIEVKSTAAVNATRVRISNLDQLDPALSDSLHLAVVHLASSTDAPDLDSRIDSLLELGAPSDTLERKLADYGYFRRMELSVPTNYMLREIRWWKVGANFPGLRSSDIEKGRLIGVDSVAYDLLLGVLPPSLPPEETRNIAPFWVGGPR